MKFLGFFSVLLVFQFSVACDHGNLSDDPSASSSKIRSPALGSEIPAHMMTKPECEDWRSLKVMLEKGLLIETEIRQLRSGTAYMGFGLPDVEGKLSDFRDTFEQIFKSGSLLKKSIANIRAVKNLIGPYHWLVAAASRSYDNLTKPEDRETAGLDCSYMFLDELAQNKKNLEKDVLTLQKITNMIRLNMINLGLVRELDHEHILQVEDFFVAKDQPEDGKSIGFIRDVNGYLPFVFSAKSTYSICPILWGEVPLSPQRGFIYHRSTLVKEDGLCLVIQLGRLMSAAFCTGASAVNPYSCQYFCADYDLYGDPAGLMRGAIRKGLGIILDESETTTFVALPRDAAGWRQVEQEFLDDILKLCNDEEHPDHAWSLAFKEDLEGYLEGSIDGALSYLQALALLEDRPSGSGVQRVSRNEGEKEEAEGGVHEITTEATSLHHGVGTADNLPSQNAFGQRSVQSQKRTQKVVPKKQKYLNKSEKKYEKGSKPSRRKGVRQSKKKHKAPQDMAAESVTQADLHGEGRKIFETFKTNKPMKFRAIVSLMKEVAKRLPQGSILHFNRRGSHINVHADEGAGFTFVQPHGGYANGVKPFIVNELLQKMIQTLMPKKQ
ncbi:MAG: hypothetical protein ACK5O7_06380 [Holosporales bacterium]